MRRRLGRPAEDLLHRKVEGYIRIHPPRLPESSNAVDAIFVDTVSVIPNTIRENGHVASKRGSSLASWCVVFSVILVLRVWPPPDYLGRKLCGFSCARICKIGLSDLVQIEFCHVILQQIKILLVRQQETK